MPQDTISFLQRIQEHGLLGYVGVLLISCWAATVRYLMSLKGKKGKFKEWMMESCVCMFVGTVTAMVCKHYEVEPYLLHAIVALSAHNGTRSLYLIGEFLKKSDPLKK